VVRNGAAHTVAMHLYGFLYGAQGELALSNRRSRRISLALLRTCSGSSSFREWFRWWSNVLAFSCERTW